MILKKLHLIKCFDMKKALAIVSLVVIAYSCGNNSQQPQQDAVQAAAVQAKQATLDSVNAANQKQKTIDSLKTIVAKESIKKEETQSTKTVTTSSTATATPEHHKKGWNSTAKGAVIGAGAGGITGALVSKNKVAGAVVGTVLGAGAGAGTGAIIDHSKKKKQNKENQQ